VAAAIRTLLPHLPAGVAANIQPLLVAAGLVMDDTTADVNDEVQISATRVMDTLATAFAWYRPPVHFCLQNISFV
jgi:hypothetical protein